MFLLAGLLNITLHRPLILLARQSRFDFPSTALSTIFIVPRSRYEFEAFLRSRTVFSHRGAVVRLKTVAEFELGSSSLSLGL